MILHLGRGNPPAKKSTSKGSHTWCSCVGGSSHVICLKELCMITSSRDIHSVFTCACTYVGVQFTVPVAMQPSILCDNTNYCSEKKKRPSHESVYMDIQFRVQTVKDTISWFTAQFVKKKKKKDRKKVTYIEASQLHSN